MKSKVMASLAAAALTAAAFAAISVAQDGGSDDGSAGDEKARSGGPMVFEHRVGPPPEISAEDRAAMEEFRACMQENGAEVPEPPDPGEFRRGEMPDPPEPPTEEERAAIEKALEACEDKLPEGAGFGIGPCGSDEDGADEEGARDEEGAAEDAAAA
ncbi:MAG: hypothetical protein ACRDKH_01635 [Solirubrobacterales bacterium]